MPFSEEYRAYVADLLAPLGPVTTRRMFGGVGLFYRGRMFGLIADDVLYFKADDGNRPDFEAAGAEPFAYDAASGKRVVMAYWRVPDEVLENENDCLAWARKAADAALRSDAAKPGRKARRAKQGSA